MRNAYNVSNLMDMWECDLLVVQSLPKHNVIHRHILSVIEVFSKYLHLVRVKRKTGPSITSAIRSLIHDDDSRRPVTVRTGKCKEFLNKYYKDMLRHEGIQF